MLSELAILMTEIDANVSHAETITHGLSDAQFNWRSEPGRWSMAQCFLHLNMANGIDLPLLEAAIRKARENHVTGEGPFTYGFLSRKFVASMEPGATKMKAPKIYTPPAGAEMGKTLAEYRRVSAEVRRLAQAAQGLHLARVKCDMPALPAFLRPFVKMPLGQRLALLITHDRRHLTQAEQVRTHPDFPKS